MPDNWRTTTLRDLVDVEHGWPFKSNLCSEELTGEPIVVNIGNFQYDGGFRFESTRTREYRGDYPADYELEPDDILLVMTCQTAGGEILGIPARVPKDDRLYLHNQRLGKVVVREPHLVDEDFIYWLFRWSKFNRALFATASGTKILHTSPTRIEAFQFELPPLSEQRRIAAILGALDDKIELNRKMNRTLEEIAQTLFQAWFVDFEGETDLVESELGLIPRGWEVRPLPEVIAINPTRKLDKGQEAPYLEMKNMPTDGARALDWYDREYGSGTRFRNGDVLVARITPCLENGKTAIVDFLEKDQIGWGSTEYLVFRSKPPLPAAYAYFLARSKDFRRFAIANMTGSSGRQRVRVSALDHYLVPVPPGPLAERFGEVADSVLTSLKHRDQESCTLAEIRDTLLPKLISGEIRVPEAEEVVEEAVE